MIVSRSRGRTGAHLARGRRLLVGDQAQQRHGVVAGERRLPRQALVQRGAQAVDVGRRSDGIPVAERLLGAHVEGRAEQRTRGGQRPAPDVLREAEVGHGHAAVRAHHQVARLDVAVDDALSVRVVERQGRVPHDAGRLARRERAAPLDQVGQVAPLDELHREPRQAAFAAGGADREDRQDAGVGQPRRGARLGAEPLDPHRVARGGRRQHLHRDASPERGLSRLVHDPHGAPAHLADQLELSEVVAGLGHPSHPTPEA